MSKPIVGSGTSIPTTEKRTTRFEVALGTSADLPAEATRKSGGVFDPETGALSRDFISYRPSKTPRGYGRTPGLDEHPFLRPQITLVVAPTGGGKTTLLLNILAEILAHVNPRRVNKIMFYTGSPQDDLLARLNPEVVDVFGPDQTESFLSELRELQLDMMGSGVRGDEVGVGEEAKPFNVIVLDDAGNSRLLTPSQTKGTDIGELMMRHRHLRIHLIISAQRWNMLPVFLRCNLTHLFLFPGGSKAENGAIFNTMDLPIDQLERVMSTLQGRKFEFLWIDRWRRTAKRGFSQVMVR